MIFLKPFKLINSCISLISLGCFAVIALGIGLTAYSIYSIKNGGGPGAILGEAVGPEIIIFEGDRDDVEKKIDSFEITLENNGEAEIILSEKEASIWLDTFVMENENGKKYVLHDVVIDFEDDLAYLYAKAPLGFSFKIRLKMEEDGDKISPVVSSVHIGKVRMPKSVAKKFTELFEQGFEQMKTRNWGSQKVTKMRFMKDVAVIEIAKV